MSLPEISKVVGLTREIAENTVLGSVTQDLIPLINYYIKALGRGKIKKSYERKGAFGKFSRPWGIAIHGTKIFVADHGNDQIQVFNNDTTFSSLPTFATHLQHPVGLVVDSKSQIIIAEYTANRLSVLDMDGHSIRTVGSLGSGEVQFSNPTDLDIDKDGNWVICDTGNNRIQTITPEGKFIRMWGEKGNGKGQFSYPCSISVSPRDGTVHVVDRDNCRVQILSSEGIFLRQLGEKGAGPGQLISPYWCTIDVEGNVIVPDFGNNRVNIFDFSGNLLLTFGQSLKSPAAVTIDADGNLFIGDFGNNQLVVWG